jgi:hypothetical protein
MVRLRIRYWILIPMIFLKNHLEIVVTDINFLPQMGDILDVLGYVPDTKYFFHQCKDIISVPEKHINNKGQGKFAFQAYFHNFPDSVLSINNNALGGVGFAPAENK